MPNNIGYGIPVEFDYINAYNSSFSPSTVHVRDTQLQRFFRRYLFEKLIGVFKFTLPETWNSNYFKYVLYAWGFIGVVETNKYGVICQAAAPYGYDIYYQPTNLIITNPLLKRSINPRIGDTCTVIKLQPDWGGCSDLVNYYADQMALTAEAFGVNTINTHFAFIFPAEKDATAQSFKKMYDKVAGGDPAVVVDKTMFKEDGSPSWEPFVQNIGQNFIGGQLLDALRTIENRFCTVIGIPTANTTKRERLITDEVNANNVETAILADLWLENLQEGITATNNMFGTSISVEYRHNPDPAESSGGDEE